MSLLGAVVESKRAAIDSAPLESPRQKMARIFEIESPIWIRLFPSMQRDNYDGRLATIKLAKLGGRRVVARRLSV